MLCVGARVPGYKVNFALSTHLCKVVSTRISGAARVERTRSRNMCVLYYYMLCRFILFFIVRAYRKWLQFRCASAYTSRDPTWEMRGRRPCYLRRTCWWLYSIWSRAFAIASERRNLTQTRDSYMVLHIRTIYCLVWWPAFAVAASSKKQS